MSLISFEKKIRTISVIRVKVFGLAANYQAARNERKFFGGSS
jgi:hypothetical protein